MTAHPATPTANCADHLAAETPTTYLRRRGWRVRADELHGGVWIFNGTLSGWQPSVEVAARAVAGGWPRMGERAGSKP